MQVWRNIAFHAGLLHDQITCVFRSCWKSCWVIHVWRWLYQLAIFNMILAYANDHVFMIPAYANDHFCGDYSLCEWPLFVDSSLCEWPFVVDSSLCNWPFLMGGDDFSEVETTILNMTPLDHSPIGVPKLSKCNKFVLQDCWGYQRPISIRFATRRASTTNFQ